MKIKTKINFGDKVEDKLGGFVGIVNGYAAYDTGCNQFLVTPKCTNNDKKDSHWFDESRLKIINTKKDGSRKPLPAIGCDIPAPK